MATLHPGKFAGIPTASLRPRGSYPEMADADLSSSSYAAFLTSQSKAGGVYPHVADPDLASSSYAAFIAAQPKAGSGTFDRDLGGALPPQYLRGSWAPSQSADPAAAHAAQGEPQGACPIPKADWRSSSGGSGTMEARTGMRTGSGVLPSEEYNPAFALEAAPEGRWPEEEQHQSHGFRGSPQFQGGTHSSPSHSSPSHSSPSLSNGLREHLLRASSVPQPNNTDFLEAGSASPLQPRQVSMSSVKQPSAPEQMLEQQLQGQIQRAERQWRAAEASRALASGRNGSGPLGAADEWYHEFMASDFTADCVNLKELEDLCASMDIAGMKVEEVEIHCPPAEVAAEYLGASLASSQVVLLSLRFEGMTIPHYPGDNRAKQLFHSLYSA